jgi:hypothetical protein
LVLPRTCCFVIVVQTYQGSLPPDMRSLALGTSHVAVPNPYTIEVAKHKHLQALLLRAINCTRSDNSALAFVHRKTESCRGAECTNLVSLVSSLGIAGRVLRFAGAHLSGRRTSLSLVDKREEIDEARGKVNYKIGRDRNRDIFL